MIAEFFKQWGDLGALGVCCITIATLLVYVVRNIVQMLRGELKDLHKESEENIKLNQKLVMIQDKTADNLGRIEQAIRNTLEMSNGNNPLVKKILERLDKVEKKA